MYKMKHSKVYGYTLADKVADFVGSWKFIIWQSVVLVIWMIVNIEHLVNFDPYPFILMNLLLSSQAAYATPMILMSSNRQAQKDREHVKKDLELDENSNLVIKEVAEAIIKLDQDLQLDRQALKDHATLRSEITILTQEFKKLNRKIDKLQKS
tara:strand:+ start:182 stop:640 length:459 start_codon:yes stop_codon:yes gene_type:complete